MEFCILCLEFLQDLSMQLYGLESLSQIHDCHKIYMALMVVVG